MVHPCPADSVKGSYKSSALLKESWQGEPGHQLVQAENHSTFRAAKEPSESCNAHARRTCAHCFVDLNTEGHSIKQKTSTDWKNWDQK